jgi:hypothetical protein
MITVSHIMFLASTNCNVGKSATFFIAAGAFSYGGLCNAQVSASAVSDTARSSAIGAVVMAGNTGGLASTWIFLPCDGSDFYIGNGLTQPSARISSVPFSCCSGSRRKIGRGMAKKSITIQMV